MTQLQFLAYKNISNPIYKLKNNFKKFFNISNTETRKLVLIDNINQFATFKSLILSV